jgi:hypothetical protein
MVILFLVSRAGYLPMAWHQAAAADDPDQLIAAVAGGEHGAFDGVFRQARLRWRPHLRGPRPRPGRGRGTARSRIRDALIKLRG